MPAAFKIGDLVTIRQPMKDQWVKSYQNQGDESFLYSIKSVDAGASNFYALNEKTKMPPDWVFSEGWFELEYPMKSTIINVDKQNSALDTLKKALDNYKYEPPFWQQVGRKHLYVHVCLWCNEPITRQQSGEYKGHWRHIQTQDPFNVVNYWVCNTSKTIDGYPHICALNTDKNLNQFSTRDVLDLAEVPHILNKGRKFKS